MSAMTFEEHRHSFLAIVDDMAMMMLALLDGVILLVELFAQIPPELREALVSLDLFIAFIFCVEFFLRFNFSKDRVHFMKKYWWELLAAIPLSYEFVQVFRLLRLLRLARLVLHIRALWKSAHTVEPYKITA